MNAFEIDSLPFFREVEKIVKDMLDKNPKFNNTEIKADLIKALQSYSFTANLASEPIVSAIMWKERYDSPIRRGLQIDFYKQIAINNASNSNDPHIVADKALDRFVTNFQEYQYPEALEISQWAFQNGYVNIVGTIYFTKDEGKTLITKYEIYRLYNKSQNPAK